MKILLILFLQSLAFIPFYNINASYEGISWLFIFINFILVSVYCFKTLPKTISLIIVIAFFTRICFLTIDLYTNIPLMHSGADSEGFHSIALINSTANNYLLKRTYFTDYLTTIYSFWGQQRLLAQYFNVILGVSSLFVFYKLMTLLLLSSEVKRYTILLLGFYPTMILMSSLLLRDMIVVSFTIYSLYFFIRWCNYNKFPQFIFAIFCLIVASIMHPGVILLGVGYALVYVLWDKSMNKMRITLKSVISLFPIFLILVIILAYPSLFMDKFSGLSEDEDIAKTVSYEGLEAGSRYLVWLQPTNILQMILFTPLKVLYFYISPTPWDVRGLGDLLSFILDSSIYIYLFHKILKKIKESKSFISSALFFALMLSSIAFAWGVVAAGTAMRHRVKLLPLIFIIYFCTNFKTSISNNINNEKH